MNSRRPLPIFLQEDLQRVMVDPQGALGGGKRSGQNNPERLRDARDLISANLDEERDFVLLV
jgi:hypothetical protein